MTPSYPKRVLRARLFDALHAAVAQFGGIGSGEFYRDAAPHCVVGFLHFLGLVGKDKQITTSTYAGDSYRLFDHDVEDAVRHLLGIDYQDNDLGVNRIRAEIGDKARRRVPFDLWAKHFNIQRAIEIPAKLYDKLQDKADLAGGIGYGAGHLADFPCCVGDYVAQIDGYDQLYYATNDQSPGINLLRQLLGESFGTVNDEAVISINSRKGTALRARVTFEELAAELNFLRIVQLPAKVYDALKEVADKFGGIGAGWFYDADGTKPLCARGMCWELQGLRNALSLSDSGEYEKALETALGGSSIASPSDAAVHAINGRKGMHPNARVSFEEWAQELNIDRVIELPAKVYDALKASADENGGIGAGKNFDDGTVFGGPAAHPLCALGHALAIDGGSWGPTCNTVDVLVVPHAITTANDKAVKTINRRKGQLLNSRVSFAEWASELGIVRGDA